MLKSELGFDIGEKKFKMAIQNIKKEKKTSFKEVYLKEKESFLKNNPGKEFSNKIASEILKMSRPTLIKRLSEN